MNFNDLLKLTEASRTASDSFRTTGEAIAKEKATGNSANNKQKDAARKRNERAKKIPRDRKSKGELVKEVIAVKTASGRVQLIFKDSFNKETHVKLNKGDSLTEDEAKSFTNDPKFEQTRASKLLFGELKKQEDKEEKTTKTAEKADGKSKTKEGEQETGEAQPQKAKRLSKEEILQAMQGMDTNQLASMPLDLQQEYFKSVRSPIKSSDFDNITFESLSNQFGINTTSNLPYNQQVINALIFAAKLKAGAGEQELNTLFSGQSNSLDFTKTAFLQANKILSQIGDECIQNLLTSIEAGNSSMYSDGVPELQCGEYKFKISAGGEFTMTTNSLNQTGKNIRGIIGNALTRTIMDPAIAKSDPYVKKLLSDVELSGNKFASELLPDQSIGMILNDPELIEKFKSYEIFSPSGESLGFAIDSNGLVNPAISVSAYEASIKKSGSELFKGGKKNSFLVSLTKNILKSSLRGDGIVDPKNAPNHIITTNGVFPMSDDYIGEIAKTASINIKQNEQAMDTSNISTYKKSAVQNLQKWRTVVEEKETKPNLKKLFVDRKSIDPLNIIVKNSIDNLSFDINASLLPGFKPEDINSVEYNYITIGKKTIKIPVSKTETVTDNLLGENYFVINEMLIESLTNNFLLSKLNKVNIISDTERNMIERYGPLLLEEDDLRAGCLIPILNKIYSYTVEDTEYLIPLFEDIISDNLEEKYIRNYKKEYKNYHGKPKQKKERASRTAARELMIKKGVVKKGSKKDIDHKNAIRNGGSNNVKNLRVRDRSENRADNGHHKGETQNRKQS
jgi:hypothetical protein